jgi:mono/diheme cytochrome c family protein
MKPSLLKVLAPAVLAAAASGMIYGGWVVTTVEDYPDSAVAGAPLTLSWVVRQHGRTPLSDLRGTVEAMAGGARIEVPARRDGGPGRYSATLTLPAAGAWRIAIRHGFGPERRELPPLEVVAPNSAARPALGDVARGERMFVTKGCVTCHVEIKAGPELGGRRYDDAWLAGFLANPMRTPALPRDADPMPNLGLQPREVAALAAYVNARQAARR